MLELAWGARTDIGCRRSRNEDAYLADPPVFAVADGMGGHARGDLAASMAVEGLRRFPTVDATRSGVLDAVRAVHDEITAQARQAETSGMGTTLCGLVAGVDATPSLLVFNVGDSRIYRQRGGDLAQLTHDHSVVQELLDDGTIDAAEAANHPERNVITRSLGSGGVLDIDWWVLEPQTGDRYLLCSDGLVRELDVARVAQILADAINPQPAADELVTIALHAGGRDNITVVVVDVISVPAIEDLEAISDDTNPRALVRDITRPGPNHDVIAPVVVAHASAEASPGAGQQ